MGGGWEKATVGGGWEKDEGEKREMEMLGEASGESVNLMEHESDLLSGEIQRSCCWCSMKIKADQPQRRGTPRMQRSRSFERLNFDAIRKKIRFEQCYYIPSNRDSAKRAMQKLFPESVGKNIHKMMMTERKKNRKMQMQRRAEDKGKSTMGEEGTEDLVMADNCSTQGETDRGTEADTWSADSEISSISETVRWLCTELEENVRLYMKIGPPSVDSDVKLVFDHVKNLFELLRTFKLGQDLNKLEMEEEKQQEEMNLEQMRNSTMTVHCHELQRTFREPMNFYTSFLEEEEEEDKEMDEGDYQSAIEEEEKQFAKHCSSWISSCDPQWGHFKDMTMLSPMLFTHPTPGHHIPSGIAGSTMEIFSIKVAKLKNAPWLKWPLQVYGVIAARDTADHNRNFIFVRKRHDCQTLTEEDPFLRLTGPYRAIVADSHVCFEIQLKVKGRTISEDRSLISEVCYDSCCYDEVIYTHVFRKHFCTMELSFRQLQQVVQATILGVRVVEGTSWPFEYGGRVSCYSPPHEVMLIDKDGIVMDITDPPSGQVVLLDSRGGEMPIGSDGYLDLSRHVVSVELRQRHVVSWELQASLKVLIQTYSSLYPNIATQGYVYITPKKCNISQAICDLGNAKVEITVAWSLPIDDKWAMMMSRCV